MAHDHVDSFIDDPRTDVYASWVLNYFRMPAVLQLKFRPVMSEHRLFCTYNGVRYRVTGASRLGDVWLAEDFKRDTGYDHRVSINDCTGWSPKP